MTRTPWRTRAGLLAAVNALAGVALALGFTTDLVDPFVALALAAIALLADLGIVRDGEGETTPVADPRTPGGEPLVPISSALPPPAPAGELPDAEIERLFAGANPAEFNEPGAD